MKLRVATHNVCHMGYNFHDCTQAFPDGKYRFGYEADRVEEMRNRWHEVYGEFSADLIGLQEYFYWVDLAHEYVTKDDVYGRYGYEVADGDMGLAVATRFPLEPVYETDFEPISKRRRQKFYLDLNGKRIAIFNAHPTPRDNAPIRAEEYALLIEEYRKEPCFIAFGDYNARIKEEYQPFRDVPYPMVNTGFGTERRGLHCDNIILSPNIRVTKTELFDRECTLSDHAVLYAELEVD